MYDLEPKFDPRPSGTVGDLTPVVCWSRMQAEAGQQLEAIVLRKETERLANGGVFCWGVGNPPAKSVGRIRASRQPVDAIFSIMKSKPKAIDAAPERVVLWRTYFDEAGAELPLPEGSIVTSRADSAGRVKASHYALICASDEPLVLGDFGSFDPNAYRNVSVEAGPIGASQVTALVQRFRPEQRPAAYRVNLRARLAGAYWVKLGSPVLLSSFAREQLQAVVTNTSNQRGWLALARSLRDGPETLRVDNGQQLPLL